MSNIYDSNDRNRECFQASTSCSNRQFLLATLDE